MGVQAGDLERPTCTGPTGRQPTIVMKGMAVHLLDMLRSYVLGLPVLVHFAVGLAAIVGAPILARFVGLPAAVGLLFFGVLLGPHVLGFFGEHRPIADFFAELGKLLLMFSAGL